MSTPSAKEKWRLRHGSKVTDREPRRAKSVMCGEGNMMALHIRSAERTCKCGYSVCSKTGVCAPNVEIRPAHDNGVHRIGTTSWSDHVVDGKRSHYSCDCGCEFSMEYVVNVDPSALARHICPPAEEPIKVGDWVMRTYDCQDGQGPFEVMKTTRERVYYDDPKDRRECDDCIYSRDKLCSLRRVDPPSEPREFKVGDRVQADGHVGLVTHVNERGRATFCAALGWVTYPINELEHCDE